MIIDTKKTIKGGNFGKFKEITFDSNDLLEYLPFRLISVSYVEGIAWCKEYLGYAASHDWDRRSSTWLLDTNYIWSMLYEDGNTIFHFKYEEDAILYKLTFG